MSIRPPISISRCYEEYDGAALYKYIIKQRTAPYKYPRIVVFRDELPKTISGKIIHSQL